MTLPQIAENPMSQVEKIARLMGYEVESVTDQGVWLIEHDKPLNRDNEHPIRLFNPLTNKADLMDVECALSGKYTVNTTADDNGFYIEVYDTFSGESIGFSNGFYRDHPDKFTARAHAVCAVAEQIYDRKHNDQNTD